MINLNSDFFVQQFQGEERLAFPQLQKHSILRSVDIFGVASQAVQNDEDFQRVSYDHLQESQPTKERHQISESVTRTLSTQLQKEEKPQVREVIAATIGQIGLPEALPCFESL
jgi:hypothetical protein